ncbi:MAG: lysophospholipid acyltransferase family protein [Rickettsiales bacterium]|nr:lysophospholipid acyltransferase family protein [Rickettsiales bacterium]
MKKIIIFFRSVLFSFLTAILNILFSFFAIFFWLPFFPNRRKNFDLAASLWCELMLKILKITVGIDDKVIGRKKLEKGRPYIIVGKHESTWDTLIMHTFMKPAPVFILKRELLFIPFFGWCLATASKIAIDRSGGASSLKKVLKEGKKYIKEGHNIIIFPQGTRVPPYSTIKEYPYKTGFIALIRELGVDIVPMALNSGKLWRKKQFLKDSGTITMEFMDPIKYEDIKKMSKEELLLKLENIIESKSKELNG